MSTYSISKAFAQNVFMQSACKNPEKGVANFLQASLQGEGVGGGTCINLSFTMIVTKCWKHVNITHT